MDTYGYNGNMSQTAYGRAFNNQQPILAPNAQQFPHYEVKRVDGENGARALPMGPNSSTFAADNTKEDRIWLIMTDAAGYRTVRPIKAKFEDVIDQQNLQDTLLAISDRLSRLEERMNNNDQFNSRGAKQGKRNATNAAASEQFNNSSADFTES